MQKVIFAFIFEIISNSENFSSIWGIWLSG